MKPTTTTNDTGTQSGLGQMFSHTLSLYSTNTLGSYGLTFALFKLESARQFPHTPTRVIQTYARVCVSVYSAPACFAEQKQRTYCQELISVVCVCVCVCEHK